MKQEYYSPKDIEKKWQDIWEKTNIFATPEEVTSENKCYVLPQLPYPSGSGLHVGHAEVYTACDIYARYKRMTGKKVLQVVGWDSFGLPAENYAIKTNVHPRKSTDDAIANFRRQIKSLGMSVDWSREVGSHNPDYYKFTQWFFLLMYKQGLAYRKAQAVNWCDSCKTVLANEQVEQGACERCGTTIIQRQMEQWYLRITDYADRLLEGLDSIDWPEETKKRQRDWIGKSEGAEIDFAIADSEETIRVFTTRPDTLFGATYMVLAPEHPLVAKFANKIQNSDAVREYVEATEKKSDLDRQIDQEKTGVQLEGVFAVHPITGEQLPIWIADYVLASYGHGAIMAVPAHDERDFAFAKVFGLEIRYVIKPEIWTITSNHLPNTPEFNQIWDNDLLGFSTGEKAFIGKGPCINSDFLNGLSTDDAKERMIAYLEEKGIGNKKVQYKLRDWSVSRQRFWGAPIPMLYDDKGELHPVPEEDLPVLLPDDVDFKPTGESPLRYSTSFAEGVEDRYGKGWRREADTLDTFMCSSWYYFRYLDPHNDKEFASPEQLKTWMPVDFYLGGAEHVNGHLLYSRFFTKVLFDAGYIDFDEPFLVHRHQGLILGEDSRKMSKRWGNVVNPTDVVEEFGADTMRVYEMFMGPLEDAKPWDTNGVKGIRRFLDRVWRLQYTISDEAKDLPLLHKTIKGVTEDVSTLGFNTAIAKMMEFVNAVTKEQQISMNDFRGFVLLLSPFAPHLAEELWQSVCNEVESIAFAAWPTYDESALVEDEITLAVQVNGKVRAQILVAAESTSEEVEAIALADETVQKWIDGQSVKKIIYIKGKLVSIVI